MDTKKILLIEDEAEDILLFRTQFQLAGYAVIEARTAQDGYDKAMSERPDLIVLDLVLGDTAQVMGKAMEYGGLKLLARLSSDGSLKDIPVVVLTNLDKDTFAAKVKSAGAREFLSKSEFLPEEIVARIKGLIG